MTTASTAIAAKERPIIFTAESVRAILDGHKTQTRRVVKPQPDWDQEVGRTRIHGPLAFPIGSFGQQCGWPLVLDGRRDGAFGIRNPYGMPGDRLWVRETVMPAEFWRSPIHMPRWASRLTLEIADVRVERVQDISEKVTASLRAL